MERKGIVGWCEMRGCVILISAIVLMATMSPVCAIVTETVYSSSVSKEVGLTFCAGDHTNTHSRDGVNHQLNISSRYGYLDYNFTTTFINSNITKIEYTTKLWTMFGGKVDIRIFNWRTLSWTTLHSDFESFMPPIPENTYTITTSPGDYVNRNTGEVRVGYYRKCPFPPGFVTVFIDFQSVKLWADESKPSQSPLVYYEEVHADPPAGSWAHVGVTTLAGDYSKTHTSDGNYHSFLVRSKSGYIEYEFNVSNKDYKLVKLQYETEFTTGIGVSEEIDIQVYNWKSLKWEQLWGSVHYPMKRVLVHTWSTSSTEYLSAEGHLRIRYSSQLPGPSRTSQAELDYQAFIFYFDPTQFDSYPYESCGEHLPSSSVEWMVGVSELVGDYTSTQVSDNLRHEFYIPTPGGYIVYNFETGVETNKSSNESDKIYSSSVLARSSIFSESGTHTSTHNSNNSVHTFWIWIPFGGGTGYLTYEFKTGFDPSKVTQLKYQTEFDTDVFCDSGIDLHVYNWDTPGWETLLNEYNCYFSADSCVYERTWNAPTASHYLSPSGDMWIRYYHDFSPAEGGFRHCTPSIDYQYVQAWMNTTSTTSNPGLNRMQYRVELEVSHMLDEFMDVEIWDWEALNWVNLWDDVSPAFPRPSQVYTYTWDAGLGVTVEDYLSDNGTVRVRYQYDKIDISYKAEAWINFQELVMCNSSLLSPTVLGNLTKPSFFDRLDGSLNLSSRYVNQTVEYFGGKGEIGLESLVSLYEFNVTGINTSSSFSWVDHLYWGNQSGCRVYGAYPWLRIDNETAKEYCLDDLLYDCV